VTARTQAFILLLFGGALTRLATSDTLLRYVRPVARPWVLVAGVAILGLAVWNLVASVRAAASDDPPVDLAAVDLAAVDAAAVDAAALMDARLMDARPTDEHSADDHDAHGHPAATRLAWFVMAPILAILVISPPALGSYSASRQTARVPQPARVDFPPLAAGSPVPVTMLDFATRVIWDNGRTVAGRSVRLTGFVLASNSSGFIMTRLVITCCAADAQPVNIQVLDPGANYPVNSWLTVTGVYAGVSPTQKTLPELRSTLVTAIKQPANPYDD
jgi:uncharacterized repeat protein (TIGR03943 family)